MWSVVARDTADLPVAPPGITPNYIDPPNNGYNAIVACILTLVLAAIAVAVRLFTKFAIVRKTGFDDFCAVLALAIATARVSCDVVAIKKYGLGRHIWDVIPTNFVMIWRLKQIADELYPLAIMFAKLGILFFYLSIFQVNVRFRYSCYGMIAFIVLYLTAQFMTYTFFYCRPIRMIWNVTVQGQCINDYAQDIATGAFNIFSDIAILILPLPMVWRLQIDLARRLGLVAIFLLGAFTAAASIIREVIVVTKLQPGGGKDQTWIVVVEIMWLSVEMNMSILCGSLLCWPHFVRQYVVETSFGDSIRSIFSSITRFSSQYSKASKGAFSGKRSTKYSIRQSTTKEGFERQPSEASLELGELGDVPSTTIQAGNRSKYPENMRGVNLNDNGINKAHQFTAAL